MQLVGDELVILRRDCVEGIVACEDRCPAEAASSIALSSVLATTFGYSAFQIGQDEGLQRQLAHKPRIFLSYQKLGSTSKLLTPTPSSPLVFFNHCRCPRMESVNGTDNWMRAQACDRVIFTRRLSYIVQIERL